MAEAYAAARAVASGSALSQLFLMWRRNADKAAATMFLGEFAEAGNRLGPCG